MLPKADQFVTVEKKKFHIQFQILANHMNRSFTPNNIAEVEMLFPW